jgi:hypothetical protein
MINTFRFHYDATIVVSVKGDFKNEQEANEKAREIAENADVEQFTIGDEQRVECLTRNMNVEAPHPEAF